MPPAPDFRPIGPADTKAVAAVIHAAFAQQSVPTDPPPSALRVTAADVEAHLQEGSGGALAEADGTVVASILWKPIAEGLYILRLAVHPGWRRLGLAHRLLTLAEAAARAAGQRSLWLETRLVLLDNRRLFGAFGFREVSRHAHPGYPHPTFVRMEKPLTD
jgi:predicted N-acetyltransferase YhbS